MTEVRHPARRPARPAPVAVSEVDGAGFRQAILKAALNEFSLQGFNGARMEIIAAEANCAKRMLYYYFESKEGLYTEVLDVSYSAIRAMESEVDVQNLPPEEALVGLAVANFNFHQKNHEFSRLVLMENLQGGKRLANMKKRAALREAAFGPLRIVVERGIASGRFNPDVNVIDLHYLISALCAFRVDHAHTWKGVLGVDLLAPRITNRHRQLMTKTLLDAVAP